MLRLVENIKKESDDKRDKTSNRRGVAGLSHPPLDSMAEVGS